MGRYLIAALILAHGLVHLWYVVLSQRLVEYEADMGWTGRSWLFTPLMGDSATRWMAAIIFSLLTVVFVTGGVGLLARQDWWRPLTVFAASLSTVSILLFWDGGGQMLVQKGLIGLVIDIIILAVLLLR